MFNGHAVRKDCVHYIRFRVPTARSVDRGLWFAEGSMCPHSIDLGLEGPV